MICYKYFKNGFEQINFLNVLILILLFFTKLIVALYVRFLYLCLCVWVAYERVRW